MTPVILSGGSGTRLWPVSRASYPKQFCEFFDSSFLQTTIDRLKPLGPVHILTVKAMQELTQKLSISNDISQDRLIFEPFGKNTSPAIGLLCKLMEKKGQLNEVVGIFPADHLILNESSFLETIELATQLCDDFPVVTIGIQPSRPATGYGYIELDRSNKIAGKSELNAFKVNAFYEKPNAETAQKYLDSGDFFWNAGIFVFKVSSMVEAFQMYDSETWSRLGELKDDLSNLPEVYANLESISVDYAIMEKLESQACISCDFGWSDVGSWEELARLGDEIPELRMSTEVSVFTKDSRNNFCYSSKPKVMGLVGVDNLIVVDTPDALLVTRKGFSEGIKDIVDQMKSVKKTEASHHPFEKRPWGQFELLSDEKDFKAKTISVDVGAQLSYQSHEKRSEFWVIVKGQAEVTLDEKTIQLKIGESINIPVGSKHRIKNIGDETLTFVEVQTGSYFGEDDITRYEDDYGRN